MRISQQGIDLIKRFEGFSSKPYNCPAGYKTIGYGHLIRKYEKFSKLTYNEAEKLLLNDLASFESAVKRLIPIKLTQGQYDALVSFTFNLGAGALQRSTLRRCALRGDFNGAGREFKRWVYCRGRKVRGLIIRREIESDLFLS